MPVEMLQTDILYIYLVNATYLSGGQIRSKVPDNQHESGITSVIGYRKKLDNLPLI